MTSRPGRFGQRSDVTLIPAPLAFDQPACRDRADLAEAWDMPDTGAAEGSRGHVPTALVAQAREVCSGCAHLIECGEHALRVGEKWGIWGGLDPAQRKALRQIARQS